MIMILWVLRGNALSCFFDHEELMRFAIKLYYFQCMPQFKFASDLGPAYGVTPTYPQHATGMHDRSRGGMIIQRESET